MDQLTPELELDDRGRIAEPTPCRMCGYDLRGLELTGTCPECSNTVLQSAHGDLLRYGSRAWLLRLSRGMLLAVVGSIATTMMIISISVVSAVLSVMQKMGALPTVLAFSSLLACGFTVVMVVGVWLVTQPDPATEATEASMSARVLARYGILITILAVPLQLWSPGPSTGAMSPMATAAFLGGAVLSMLSLVGWLALLVHLRRLALRIPRPGLAAQTRIVLWGYAVFTAMMTIGGFGTVLLMPTVAPTGASGGPGAIPLVVLALTAAIGFVLYLVFEVWFIVLMFLFHFAFSAVALEAQQS